MGETLEAIHRLIAYAVVAGVVAGIGWSVVLVLGRRTGGPGFERFQAAVVSLVIVGAASGLALVLFGARPAEGLHLLYAVIAVALVPLGRSFLGRASGRGASVLLLVAFVVLGAILYRLYTTG